jgi:hypothetical protein
LEEPELALELSGDSEDCVLFAEPLTGVMEISGAALKFELSAGGEEGWTGGCTDCGGVFGCAGADEVSEVDADVSAGAGVFFWDC